MLALVKKIVIPFSKDELLQQHNFINYLNDNGFNNARILNLYERYNNYYEVQEYIEGIDKDNNYDTNDLIKLIAEFHKLSKEYSGSYSKKNYYKMKFKCRGITLQQVLLNFSDKYFVFPFNNYKKNKHLVMDEICIKEVDTIVKNYIRIYNFFVNNYDINSCIIHNDITSNNVIFNNKGIFLIDFDLSIVSTEYVDFIDAIVKRHNSIYNIIENYEVLKKDLNEYIVVYNSINNYVRLDINGCLAMLVLKLVAVHLYLLLNEHNLCDFIQNNHGIYVLVESVMNDLRIRE